jgi:hypothetical protein
VSPTIALDPYVGHTLNCARNPSSSRCFRTQSAVAPMRQRNMKTTLLRTLILLLLTVTAALPTKAAVAVQDPVVNTVGAGDEAWSYLLLEAEDFVSELNTAPDAGFVAVDNSETRTNALGNPVLRKLTSASKKGALYTLTGFAPHSDKVTYQVKFAKAGTYYLYMRFTMFENGGNLAGYLSEDSFFVPPDWGKDPQTDWPTGTPRDGYGGYTEGCCDGGFLTIIDDAGLPVTHSNGDADGRAFWEGNFHWNELKASQFLGPDEGVARQRFKYEVTEAQVGQTLEFTVSYREGGVTIDAFLFSTNPDLMTTYKQSDLDRTILHPVAVQSPTDVAGPPENQWAYLLLEAENYIFKANPTADAGFIRVDNTEARTNPLGHPILGTNTTASGKGALFTQSIFGEHLDKVTYRVQFATAGTYYLYMRFTMYENGGNQAHYINEDSFFLPPGFGKDPQTDWPLPRGGYVEGCCDQGFLTIEERGVATPRRDETEENLAYWEGNFHWNKLQTSQFNNPATQGEQSMRIKYEVTADMLNKPLDFTISYREGGLTIDAFLFSTNPDITLQYNGWDLDHMLVNPVSEQKPGNVFGTGDTASDYFILEGEDFDAKANPSPTAGFTRVDNTGLLTSSLGNPILGTNSTASGGGALFTQSVFGEHLDKVAYQVQFAKAGTYYLYMRFTMFENGGNVAHYINEDSFFVPPDFGKDPQTDWPLPRGGYVEGCCDQGFLTIEDNGVITTRRDGTPENVAYWEGNFHWNKLQTSQFNNPETQGEQSLRIKYEVTESMVGKPLEFTISYREGGVMIDAFIFSTDPDLLTNNRQAALDAAVFGVSPGVSLAAQLSGANVTLSWPDAEGYKLQYVTAIPAADAAWIDVQEAPVLNGSTMSVTITGAVGSGNRFYRLVKP